MLHPRGYNVVLVFFSPVFVGHSCMMTQFRIYSRVIVCPFCLVGLVSTSRIRGKGWCAHSQLAVKRPSHSLFVVHRQLVLTAAFLLWSSFFVGGPSCLRILNRCFFRLITAHTRRCSFLRDTFRHVLSILINSAVSVFVARALLLCCYFLSTHWCLRAPLSTLSAACIPFLRLHISRDEYVEFELLPIFCSNVMFGAGRGFFLCDFYPPQWPGRIIPSTLLSHPSPLRFIVFRLAPCASPLLKSSSFV